jgi:hypothetical protein
MKKVAAMVLGVALGAATLTAAPQPAKADGGVFLGGLVLGLIVGAHHPEWSPFNWHHVHWCQAQYRTYNKHTNLYYYKPGHQKACRSPYWHGW